MPYFFASLKVAVTQAFVGTVIAETVASNRGIGNLMMIASSSFDVPLVFAGLLILAVLGVALYVIFSFIEVRVTGWARAQGRIRAAAETVRFARFCKQEHRMHLTRCLAALAVAFALSPSRRVAAGIDQDPLHARLEAAGHPRLVFLGAGEGLFRRREARRHHRSGRGLGGDGDAASCRAPMTPASATSTPSSRTRRPSRARRRSWST